jgi:quercetin dioxygenase-like cupin family protein
MGDDERLREHPRERFSEKIRKLTLADEFDNLLNEAHEPVDDHRQVTLVHRHGLSLILFYFDKGGFMPDHQVDGEVSIHVLEGELEIDAGDSTTKLGDDEILILAPGVEHDVEALTATKMLLTIDMNDEE